VAREVTLHLPTFDESREIQERVWGHSLDAQFTERVRVLVRSDASPTSFSAHGAIDRLASAATLGLTVCDGIDGIRPFGRMKDWDGELSAQQWAVFKEALDIPAQNDIAALLKMLDEELTNAMVQARAVHGGGIRHAPATAGVGLEDGANVGAASRKKNRRNRKPKYDWKADAKVARRWETASTYMAEFAKSNDMTLNALKRLLARVARRESRANK
jgi:hypothetical protein